MSTLTVSNISNGSVSTSSTNVIQGSAKAWVQFVGGNPATINSSYNVSSVTFQSTGRYFVTFTNAFADAKYVMAGSASPTTDLAIFVQTGLQSNYGTNTGSVCFLASTNMAATQPAAFVNVAFFR